MPYVDFKQTLFNRIWECPMPPIEYRYEIINLAMKYKDLVDSIINMKNIDIGKVRSVIRECDNIECTLDGFFKRIVKRGMIGHTLCRLIELGEYGFIRCWLDYEPDQLGTELEETPCEICGKDREGFTENLCEECFDNETDKFYDGGIDEDE